MGDILCTKVELSSQSHLTSPFCDIEAIKRFRSVIGPTEWAFRLSGFHKFWSFLGVSFSMGYSKSIGSLSYFPFKGHFLWGIPHFQIHPAPQIPRPVEPWPSGPGVSMQLCGLFGRTAPFAPFRQHT